VLVPLTSQHYDGLSRLRTTSQSRAESSCDVALSHYDDYSKLKIPLAPKSSHYRHFEHACGGPLDEQERERKRERKKKRERERKKRREREKRREEEGRERMTGMYEKM
jgi:hypothetical protein